MSKRNIISGAAVLFAANLTVKITGVIYKIPLQRLIGDMGMGYFNVAYGIYTWFFLVSTSGLPIAVSILVARAVTERKYGLTEKIFRVSLSVFSAVGLICSALMVIFGRRFAAISGIENSYLCIYAIAPSVFLSCASSSVRGYYQGHGVMWVTAASLMIEGLGKTVFGIIFAFASVNNGCELYVTSACAIAAITAGSLLSAIFCLTVKLFYKRYKEVSEEKVLSPLLKTALPVALTSSVMNLSSVTDAFIAPAGLISTGYTEQQATEIFGNYSTLCLSFSNLPLIFIYPVTSAVLPVLSAYICKNDIRKASRTYLDVIRYSLFISAPCAVGMGVLSEQLLSLLFPYRSASLAAPMLSALSLSVTLSALLAVTDTALQAAGKPTYPVISMASGVLLKLLSMFILFKTVGRLAVPIATCLCYLTAVVLNTVFIRKPYRPKKAASVFIRPALCSALCGVTAYFVYPLISPYMPDKAATVVTVFAAAALYLLAVYTFEKLKPSGLTYIIKNNIIKTKDNKNDGIRNKGKIRFFGSLQNNEDTALSGRLSVGHRTDSSIDKERLYRRSV